MKIDLERTIAAISTPLGKGGIGIVRISGKDSLFVLEKIFRPVKQNKSVSKIKSHTINYGHIVDADDVIDEVLVTFMKAPNSYTCEDVVEINCHGGIKSVSDVLDVVLKNGAFMAEPGEFTKRAFINGRIDLSQADAVIDIINAKTELSRKAAVNRLEGRLSKKIKQLRDEILTMSAHIEAAIDYPEHDDEFQTFSFIKEKTFGVMEKIEKLIDTADSGKIVQEGIDTVILGKPNVGKSSLLNCLIEEERAIVTDIPGTTRDILKEYINIGGIPLNIIDTAGIRQTDDEVEKKGVEMSKKYAENADLILLLIDYSKPLDNSDFELLSSVKNKDVIVIANKVDLPVKADIDKIYDFVSKERVLKISVKEEKGIDGLFDTIKKMFMSGKIDINEELLISSDRNKGSLYAALNSLKNAIETIQNGMPEDFLTMDLLEAYKALGEITGESVDEDIIDKIFSEFCLGK